MKFILAQPSILRFQWELEVLLTNLKQFGEHEVTLLFSEHDFTVPTYLANKYGCGVFMYQDMREDKGYIPAIRPYLLWRHFSSHPELTQETYFYIDSDIIFREMVDFATLGGGPKVIVGSDCSSYINYDYLIKCRKGEEIVAKMAEICGITVNQMKTAPGIGAQLLLTNPTAAFWERSYHDSNRIYNYLNGVDSNIQKWTAEMWAQLWGWVREGYELKMPKSMDFCRPTDDIAEWGKVSIMHNAGVTGSGELFFKGAYDLTSPLGKDFSYVSKKKVSSKYVEALAKVL